MTNSKKKPKNEPVIITVISLPSSEMGYVFVGNDPFFVGNYHDFHTGCFGDAIFDYLAANHGWHKGRFGLADALCRYLTASGIKAEVVHKTGQCAKDNSSLSSKDQKSLPKNNGLTREQYQKLIIDIPKDFRQKKNKIEEDAEERDAASLAAFIDKNGIIPQLRGSNSSSYLGLGEKSLSGFVLMRDGYPLSYSGFERRGKETSYSLASMELGTTYSCSDIAIFKNRASAQKFVSAVIRYGKTYEVLPASKILAKFYIVKKESDEKIICEVYKNNWLKEQNDYLDNHDVVDAWHRVNWKGIAFTSENAAKKALINGAKKRLAEAQAEVARAKRILKAG